ncbi:Efflux pump [Lachnellula hyalina]|uniref:Efflux pump n=1 Tax=Lachnellula hyalina TaxID=1316788 RepID=A0A8H8QTM1_9HELO|nr:Efflux pump [Lachnellula hyalina]TVY22562.1 Efflux pump [Lachnellula hyalina]
MTKSAIDTPATNLAPKSEGSASSSGGKETEKQEQGVSKQIDDKQDVQDVTLEKGVDAAGESSEDGGNYLPMGPRLYMITLSLMLGVFCVALDNNIIAVAIPRITDEFHALNDVGWYGSAYLLPGCGFQLLFGKFYSLFSVKCVYLSGLLLFEIGTVICGAAPNSIALIVGRAIAGVGSSGLFTGAMLTIAHTVPLAKRPAFMGIVGGVYGIASVVGPLIGGAFTDHVTWRWCFFINLPFGGITTAGVLFFLNLKEKPVAAQEPWTVILRKLDPIGSLLFVPAIICLLLALQWGGVTYEWSNGRVIALLVVFVIALLAFIVLQLFIGDDATVPARIASQRSMAFASLFSFCLGASFFIVTYYIPIWFQAIKGKKPVVSGIDFLPFILPEIVGVILSGGLVSAFGYTNPFFIASSIMMSIAAGLCTLFTVETSQAAWAGYQFLWGIGIGIGFQQGTVTASTVLAYNDIAVGTAMVLFANLFGGAVFVAVAQNLFASHLIDKLLALDLPGVDPQVILHAGATNLRTVVGPENLARVLVEYNDAIVQTFRLGMIMSCISIIGAIGVEWKSVKK